MPAEMADADDADAQRVRDRASRALRPTTTMPAASAAWTNASPSRTSVLPASIDSASAPAARIAAIVATPTTGTSKRMSCAGFATLTTRVPAPASAPARAIAASVPSIASTATTARSLTTMVWPTSSPAMASATR